MEWDLPDELATHESQNASKLNVGAKAIINSIALIRADWSLAYPSLKWWYIIPLAPPKNVGMQSYANSPKRRAAALDLSRRLVKQSSGFKKNARILMAPIFLDFKMVFFLVLCCLKSQKWKCCWECGKLHQHLFNWLSSVWQNIL